MLSFEQQAQLAVAICATAETLGQTISATAAELMAKDLSCHAVEQIATALQACRRELAGKLTLAAILERVHAEDGRPGRDEAWSIALQAEDERDTVVMTEEIMAALQVARPILHARDKVGARMAFLNAYDRLVAAARSDAKPVKWSVSIGFDPQLRARAIEQARDLKRLTFEDAERHLNHLRLEAPSGNGAAIAGLLTGSVGTPDPEVRRRLQIIRDDLEKRRRRSQIQARWDRRKALRELEARRAAVANIAEGKANG